MVWSGLVWSGLTPKSDQIKNFGLEIFQTGLDCLNHKTELDQTVLQRIGLVYGF